MLAACCVVVIRNRGIGRLLRVDPQTSGRGVATQDIPVPRPAVAPMPDTGTLPAALSAAS